MTHFDDKPRYKDLDPVFYVVVYSWNQIPIGAARLERI